MDRLAAEFFANLANYPELKNLERWEKEKLVADVKKAGLLKSEHSKWRIKHKQIAGGGLEGLYPGIFESWSTDPKERPPMTWLPIKLIHPSVYKIINALLDSGEADVHGFYKGAVTPAVWKLDNGKVVPEYDKFKRADNELWIEFVRLVLSPDLFPFRRCALCRTIFVPASKKQKKFCTKECANKAVSLTPARHKYMKQYMKERRSNGNK